MDTKYCHHCGKKNLEKDSFCSNCGRGLAKLKDEIEERVEEIEEEVEEIVEKKGYGGLIIFIIFLAIIGYVILDLWAMSQLVPVISASSIWASITNLDTDLSWTQTSVSTTMRVENPTFVPIVFARIGYDANYGETEIAEAKTGFFVIGPYSQKDIPLDLRVHNLGVLKSGVGLIWDTIAGSPKEKSANLYIDLGIFKFKLGEVK